MEFKGVDGSRRASRDRDSFARRTIDRFIARISPRALFAAKIISVRGDRIEARTSRGIAEGETRGANDANRWLLAHLLVAQERGARRRARPRRDSRRRRRARRVSRRRRRHRRSRGGGDGARGRAGRARADDARGDHRARRGRGGGHDGVRERCGARAFVRRSVRARTRVARDVVDEREKSQVAMKNAELTSSDDRPRVRAFRGGRDGDPAAGDASRRSSERSKKKKSISITRARKSRPIARERRVALARAPLPLSTLARRARHSCAPKKHHAKPHPSSFRAVLYRRKSGRS